VKMKTRSAAEPRQTPAERLRRARAASAALRAAFPGVAQLRLELNFRAAASTPASQSHVLHPPAPAFFRYPCPYADCDGEFDLGGAVQAAVADPARRASGVLVCAGARSGDHASKRPCQLNLDYIVTVLCQNGS
jgi:hypothetical protein